MAISIQTISIIPGGRADTSHQQVEPEACMGFSWLPAEQLKPGDEILRTTGAFVHQVMEVNVDGNVIHVTASRRGRAEQLIFQIGQTVRTRRPGGIGQVSARSGVPTGAHAGGTPGSSGGCLLATTSALALVGFASGLTLHRVLKRFESIEHVRRRRRRSRRYRSG